MSRATKAPCTRCAVPCNSTSGLCRDCFLAIPARERSGTFGDFQMRPSHLKTLKARIPENADMAGTYISARPLVEPAVARAASLTVCAHAAGLDDARELLEMLGLAPAP